MAASVPHLLTLADLTAPQIMRIVSHAHYLKQVSQPWLLPLSRQDRRKLHIPSQSLFGKSIALLFSKRSTRTRLAAETSAMLLGGNVLFLGSGDIQLGVNESLRDSARVIGGMCQGIFARVAEHEQLEEMVKYSPVPVLNALSSLWHPTQILANLLTLHEHAELFSSNPSKPSPIPDPTVQTKRKPIHPKKKWAPLPELPELTISYVGDSVNVFHDMLVTYPRLGHKLRVASPEAYRAPKAVWDRVEELGCDKNVWWGADPREAVKDADVVITDTWISMGMEHEAEQRLKDFQGYQVTEKLCQEGGAKPHWKFMHCLPRKSHEVDDEVFYGPRSLAFQESDNRKWTTMAIFDLLFGKWNVSGEKTQTKKSTKK